MSSISSYVKAGAAAAVVGGITYGVVKACSWVKANVQCGVCAALIISEFDVIHAAHPDTEDAQQAIKDRLGGLLDPSSAMFDSTVKYLLKAYDSFLSCKAENETTPVEE